MLKKYSLFSFLFLLFSFFCFSVNAQQKKRVVNKPKTEVKLVKQGYKDVVRMPFIQTENLESNYKLLETTNTTSYFEIKFLFQSFFKALTTNLVFDSSKIFIKDVQTGKVYKCINEEFSSTVAGNVSFLFKLKFEALPREVKLIDIYHENAMIRKADHFYFKNVHLINNNERTNQQNLDLMFSKYQYHDLIKNEILEFAKKPNVVVMPHGWLYELKEKGSGKAVDLDKIGNNKNINSFNYNFSENEHITIYYDMIKNNMFNRVRKENKEKMLTEGNWVLPLPQKGNLYLYTESILFLNEGDKVNCLFPSTDLTSTHLRYFGGGQMCMNAKFKIDKFNYK